MTAIRHPLRGVLINDISEIRTGKLNDDEQITARSLLEQGHPRHVVAAMLGCHPLAINASGRQKPKPKQRFDNGLRTVDARTDPRQYSILDEILGTDQEMTRD